MSSGKFRSRVKIKPKNLGDHDISQCNHRLNNRYIHHKPAKATEGKETVKVYNTDGTREIIVPNRNPTDLPAILPKTEMERLTEQAHVITKQERMAMIEEAERKRQLLQEESMKRKEILQKAKITQQAHTGSTLRNVEIDAKRKNLYLLERAFELRQEQEDEIKKANGVILATKCRAIRNAQLAEKAVIQKELEEEDRRLDLMMEQKRQKEVELEKQKKQTEEQKKQKFVIEMMQQMKENENERLLEAERIEEESRMMNRALIQRQKDEEEKERQKLEKQRLVRQELKQANEELEKYKIILREEERVADLRVKEFMMKKAEREAAREEELRATKAAKQREIARLQAQQQRAQDQQAALDELNALRIQEEVEREWRAKEIEAAKKKKEKSEELRLGRAIQIDDIRKAQAMELARDEEEFNKVAKVQKELQQKDLEEKRLKREAKIKHRKELLKQINEKERERIVKLQEKFAEGSTLRLEQEVRSIYVNHYMKQKVEKLRENKLPENYIRDIERQLKLVN